MAESTAVVIAALAANAPAPSGIVGCLRTQSPDALGGAHSISDTGNRVFLLINPSFGDGQ